MDVLLVGAELEENLALRYLGASLRKAGHTPSYARFDNPGDTAEVVAQAARLRPGLIGLSATFQFRAKEFGALAGALREGKVTAPIVVGGHFPTFAFREMLEEFPSIDVVARHEGEATIVELADAAARGPLGPQALLPIDGLAFRGDDGAVVVNRARALAEDLDALPFPERFGDPQLHLGIPAAFLVGTRGCYGHCTFCCIHAYLRSAGGPKYRARSPENVAEEMAELRRTRGARMFVFHDDDFFTRDHVRDLERVTALRDELWARGVRDIAMVVKARPDDVDPQVFDVLEQIGLLRVYLGIESGSTRGLKVLGRGVDMADNRRALAFLQERDVYTCFNMLVFDPESSIAGLRESFQFLREIPSVPMNFCRTEIYVGTPLMTKLEREGRLIGDAFGWDYVIREPRAERAFRIFAKAFLDRNFRCDGLMNSTLGLGYHAHLLRQFYPRATTRALRELADTTTRAVNTDSVDRMLAILDFAASPASDDAAARADFTARATEAANAASKRLEARVAEATDAFVRAAFSPPRAAPRVPVWKAVSAAALALGPIAACGKSTALPPPDPLPPPTQVQPPPPDPLPPPFDAAAPEPTATTTTTATSKPLPPPDPLPMPFDAGGVKKPKKLPPPPDPLPPPHTR
ncbi:MAG: cobalamin-dependent protein [Deltaproteobacteria bacterium]|nr:cobalamin-dependent protein [Deltaproteobacteria bacterium]